MPCTPSPLTKKRKRQYSDKKKLSLLTKQNKKTTVNSIEIKLV